MIQGLAGAVVRFESLLGFEESLDVDVHVLDLPDSPSALGEDLPCLQLLLLGPLELQQVELGVLQRQLAGELRHGAI